MTSRIFALGAVAALAAISAVSAVGPVQPRLHATAPGTAKLQAFGSRSAEQRASATGSKFDACACGYCAPSEPRAPGSRPGRFTCTEPGCQIHSAGRQCGRRWCRSMPSHWATLSNLKAALVGLGLQRAGVVFQRCRRMAAGIDNWTLQPHLTELHAIRAAMCANAHRRGHLARRFRAAQRYCPLG